jgi:hypothetical protein
MAKVSEDEVLLLWRALVAFRSGRRPACGAKGRPPRSSARCVTSALAGDGPDDYLAVMEERRSRPSADVPLGRAAGSLTCCPRS